MKIRDGNSAFELRKYALAIELLGEEYEKTNIPERKSEKAFLLGESHYRMGNYKMASNWYEESIRYNYGVEAAEAYAGTLMNLEQYRQAEKAYQTLLSDFGRLDEWENAVAVAKVAQSWIDEADDRPIRVNRVDFNSQYSDYSAVEFSADVLVFSSDRFNPEYRDDTYSWTGRHFFNYFTYDQKTGQYTDQFDFLNSEFNEGTMAFSKDRKTVFFTRCITTDEEDGFCNLYLSKQSETGFWSDPEKLPFQEEGANYAHPTTNEDGSMVIFSYKPVDSEEGYNLYVSYQRGPEWVSPILLEGNINTTGNETFPFLHNDSLYFSSDGHPGMGGLDIFKAVLQPNGSWGQIENLRPPFNSGADDFGFVVSEFDSKDEDILQIGYFTSSRNGAIDDIFYFEQFAPEDDEIEDITYSLRLEGIVFEHLYQDPSDPNSKKLGVQNLPNATVEIIGPDQSQTIETGTDARFQDQIEFGKDYIVAASAPGYLRKTREVKASQIEKNPDNPRMVVAVDLTLDRLFTDKEIVLDDIYYDFDRWAIREDAKPTLIQLATILKDNPNLKIELSSHTDCRGSETYNLELSQNRAQSAVDFLIENGITSHRLTAKGYGETNPRVNCPCDQCTEEQHQQNRRTSFTILNEE